jgi:putative ABC transport system permease protein
MHMITVLLKSAIRSLQKRKWYSILSILGLSVGFSSFIIIGLFIKYELNWDRFNENYENIYRIQTLKTIGEEYIMQSAPAIVDHISNEYSDIVNQGLVFPDQLKYLSAKKEQEPMELDGQFADQGYLDIFTFKFIYGSEKESLSEPMTIILSRSASEAWFGSENPVGATLWYEKKFPLKVTGVYEDLPKNSHLRPEYIISIESLKTLWNRPLLFEEWDFTVFYTYILTRENADIEKLNASIRDLLKDKVLTDYRQLYLRPLSKLYLAATNNNYVIVMYMLSIFSICVLLLAAINYMNMIISTSRLRAKEVGIKKVVGSSRLLLVIQIYMESLLTAISSFLLSLLFVELSLDLFNRFTDKSIRIDLLLTDNFWVLNVTILIVVSAVASLYPAWMITSVRSVDLFKRDLFTAKRNRLNFKKILIGFQFSVSIGLITMAILLSKQVVYMHSKDLGYQKENMVFAELESSSDLVTISNIKTQFKNINGIESVSISRGFPMHSSRNTSSRMINWEGASRNERVGVRQFWVGYDFIPTLDMQILEGRNFSRDFPSDIDQSCLINETAAKTFGWDHPIGKYLDDQQLQVVGVFKDIHFHDIYNQISPMVLTLKAEDVLLTGPVYFGFRITPEAYLKVKPQIETALAEFFPQDPFEVELFTDHFNRDDIFQVFDTIIHIFIFLAVIAILLSVFGVIGLVNHSLNQRTKEIAIRKVNGCTSWAIFRVLTIEYLSIILIAAVFGSLGARIVFSDMPLYYPMPQQLSDYLISVIIALIITMLSIFYKTIKESTRNPVESLRYE